MSILKRTVLYYPPSPKSPRGTFRFPGWALVTTTLGTMLEPFNINDRFVTGMGQSVMDFDPSDIMARVDDMQPVSDRLDWKTTSFGETMPVGGGDLLPRTYNKKGNERWSNA